MFLNWQTKIDPLISLCMISKNESKRLKRCVDSVRGLVKEIILVDTGSDDNTIDLGRQLGCKVYPYFWEDDFSIPRNLSLEKASGDWLLILDPDEVLSPGDHLSIKSACFSRKSLAYQMLTRNYSSREREVGFKFCKGEYKEEGNFKGYVESNKTRLFRNGLGIRFEGCYHEMVDYDLIRRGISRFMLSVPVHHFEGEICQQSYDEKRRFYLMLAEKKTSKNPKDYQAWWERGVSESIAGLPLRALSSMIKSLDGGFVDVNRLFTICRIANSVGKKDVANFAFEKAIALIYPNLTHISPQKKSFRSLVFS